MARTWMILIPLLLALAGIYAFVLKKLLVGFLLMSVAVLFAPIAERVMGAR